MRFIIQRRVRAQKLAETHEHKTLRFESASNAQKYMISRGGANSEGCTQVIHANSAQCANQSGKNRMVGTGTRSGIFAAVLGAFPIFSSGKNVIKGCKCNAVFKFNQNQPRKVTQQNGLYRAMTR
jgi:hypothetical protein